MEPGPDAASTCRNDRARPGHMCHTHSHRHRHELGGACGGRLRTWVPWAARTAVVERPCDDRPWRREDQREAQGQLEAFEACPKPPVPPMDQPGRRGDQSEQNATLPLAPRQRLFARTEYVTPMLELLLPPLLPLATKPALWPPRLERVGQVLVLVLVLVPVVALVPVLVLLLVLIRHPSTVHAPARVPLHAQKQQLAALAGPRLLRLQHSWYGTPSLCTCIHTTHTFFKYRLHS